MVNFIFRKIASCWPKFLPLTRKWFFTLIFTSIHFQRERERERERRESPNQRESERRESLDRRAPIVNRAARRTIAPRRRAARSTGDRWDRAVRSSGRSHRSSIDERRDRWAVRVRQVRSSIDDRTARRSSLIAPLVARRWFIFFCWVLVSFAWIDAFSVKIFEWTKHRNGSRSTARSSNWKHFRRWWFFFLGYGLCFPSSFPNTRKYFPENFLKCNQTHGNIFLFRKLAFPENMYFSENVLQQPNTVLICFIDVAGQGWPA